ncbi:MAG TPA: GGDEF domain-containing protein [Thermoanaerobaculaceae bacterium]|nr:GGDEF domain-containing protein [Acidobacteriota bacterium]HPW56698.1 GGDEF domain-containing protein [Thermoanaerobaculaceae bacterium]
MVRRSEPGLSHTRWSGEAEAAVTPRWLRRLLGFFEARPPIVVLAAAMVVIGVLGLIDALTGPELRFFVFYWPPIALVTWVAGRRLGLVAVALSGLVWLVANLPLEGPSGMPEVVAWNLLVNTMSFAALALGVAYIRKVSDRQRTMALTDFMTGVPNARAFLAALPGELDRARRHGKPLSLAYLDVDDFKSINDTLGHEAGNELLRVIAQSIRAALRASDTVARLGGDEFAMLLPESDLAAARGAVERVLAQLAEEVARRRWPVTFSVGLVSCTTLECTSEEMLQRADALMYEVKREGKSSLRGFEMGAAS